MECLKKLAGKARQYSSIRSKTLHWRKMASNPPPFVEVAAGSRAPVERQRVAQSALQISRRSLCRVATWNCRSLLKQAQKDVLARELSRKDITLAAVQESRLAKQGDIHIGQGYRLLYSGGEKAGQKGVGIAISSEAYKALIAWVAISDRLMSATFRTPFGKLHVLSAYAPTNKRTAVAAKDIFYAELKSQIDTLPKRDCILLLADLNARVGPEPTKNLKGPHYMRNETEANDNGCREKTKVTVIFLDYQCITIHCYNSSIDNSNAVC